MFLLNLLTSGAVSYDDILFIIGILFYIAWFSVAIGMWVVLYLLQAFGIRKMLKSVGFEKTWYAFLPVFDMYAIGYLADKYDDGKEKTNYAKKLLRLSISAVALVMVFILSIVLLIVFFASGASEMNFFAILAIFVTVALYLAMFTMIIICSVQLIKAYWRIYRVFARKQSVLFLLLSIFASATPIILFIIRKREPQNLRVSEPTRSTTYYPSEN